MKYQVPIKTFIVGEYNVMYGGNGVLLATAPYFFIDIDKIQSDRSIDYFATNSDIKLSGGETGFGSSSASFLSIYRFLNEHIDLSVMLDFYRSISESKFKPSGADLVTQFLGGITIFAGAKSRTLTWSFSDYDILIFKTRTKIQTYKHLNSDLDLDNKYLSSLQNEVLNVIDGITNCDINKLSDGINNYQQILLERKLVSDETKSLLYNISKLQQICAFKGCGALCNDAIITLNLKVNSDSIKKELQKLGLKYIASTDDIVGGMNVVC